MNFLHSWKPTKFIYHKGKLRASRDPAEVAVSSRLIADLLADLYERLIKEYGRGKLLDLGCGKAPLRQVYESVTDSQICVDWNNTTQFGDVVNFKMDLTKRLDFGDDTFDTILITDVLEHIPNPENLFDEMVRILKKNGTIILGVPFFYWLHEEPHDFYRYTEYKLQNFCFTRNLKILSLEPYGGVPEILLDVIIKNIPKNKFLLTSFFIFASWLLRRKVCTTLKERTRKKFPFGYTLVAKKLVNSWDDK